MTVLDEPIYLKRVIIYNQKSGQQDTANRFRDISVRAGNRTALPFDGSTANKENEVCDHFTGPARSRHQIHFNCTEVKPITVSTVQIINDNYSSI